MCELNILFNLQIYGDVLRRLAIIAGLFLMIFGMFLNFSISRMRTGVEALAWLFFALPISWIVFMAEPVLFVIGLIPYVRR